MPHRVSFRSDLSENKKKEEGVAPHLFVEVDFAEICINKCAAIGKHKELRCGGVAPSCIPSCLICSNRDCISNNWDAEVISENGELHGPRYRLLPADLRDIDALEKVLARAGIDFAYVLAVMCTLARSLTVCCCLLQLTYVVSL